MDLGAADLFEMLAERQHGGMLDLARDDFVAAGLRFERRQDRGVVAFRAAGGVDDFMIMRGAEQLLQLLARRLQGAADAGAKGMDGGGDCRTAR